MKRIFSIKVILILVLQYYINITAQVVFTDVNNDIYNFLERMSLKRIVDYHDEVKPLPRIRVAELLNKINTDTALLNNVEKEELSWYVNEYADEMKMKERERWYLFHYNDSLFDIKAYPLAGYGINYLYGSPGHTRWIGAGFFATYSDWFGGNMNIKDKGEFGDNVDTKKIFSPETGAFYKSAPNGIEFSDVTGSISFDWHWGSVSLIKDYLKWGHGNFSQLIISPKSPSFPFIRLDLHPVDWLRFYYIHGWLSSQVIDSSRSYYTNSGTLYPLLRNVYINKYIAANFLSASFKDILDFSLGNSIIYSGDLRPEMFIPFMFFKFLDHNTGRGDVNDGNGQMFFDAAVKYPDNFKFYSTVFIDVTEIRNVLQNDFHNTWYGFTIGGKKIDLFIPNLDLTVEYTRVSPWVYEHKDQTTTYKNLNFVIGDWLGQNADQFRFQFDWEPLRGLKFKMYNEFIRKGGLKDIYFAYAVKENEKFLYPPVRREYNLGIEASYEFKHDLFAEAYYIFSNISDQEPLRTPAYLIGKKNSIGLTIYYGFK